MRAGFEQKTKEERDNYSIEVKANTIGGSWSSKD